MGRLSIFIGLLNKSWGVLLLLLRITGMICWLRQSLHWIPLYMLLMVSHHSRLYLVGILPYQLTELFLIFMIVRFMLWPSWFEHVMIFKKRWKLSLQQPTKPWQNKKTVANDMWSFLWVSMCTSLVSMYLYLKGLLGSWHQNGLVPIKLRRLSLQWQLGWTYQQGIEDFTQFSMPLR